MRNILLIFTLIFLGCNKPKEIPFEYYVISKQDSINKKSDVPPPPPPPQKFKFYSDIVFIMDSRNKVYIYQTENTNRFVRDNRISKLIFDYNFPNYLGLKPENLITYNSNDFIAFIKANNDIFGLNNDNGNHVHKFLYIVSESDTVKNDALYQLGKILRNDNVNYIVRRTTEEENFVLKFKRNKSAYFPEKLNWSSNFINGNFKPFTKEYEKLEEQISNYRKAKETYKLNSMEYYPEL
jgi:hypothetical protein